MAIARAMLERYGIVLREAAQAEGLPGGFANVYDVYRALEDQGRVRRGYFVAERGATQFALPGADDRLRAAREPTEAPRVVVLAATDPANPYGAILAWPARGKDGRDAGDGNGEKNGSKDEKNGSKDGKNGTNDDGDRRGRPQRAAGCRVILQGGTLLGFLGKREEQLLTFLPTDEPLATAAAGDLAAALADLVDSGRRRALLLVTIDGVPATSHPMSEVLLRAGFTKKATGLWKRTKSASLEPRVRGQGAEEG